MTDKESVVLLHGIFRTRRCMQGLGRFLENGGYHVTNIGYPSTRYPLEELVQKIHPEVEKAGQDAPKLHFVGYSMGGLLIRSYIHTYRPPNLGRVVMLGTPNQGSEVADFLQQWKIYRWLYGAAGQQLITKQNGFAHCLGKVDYELGIIAGNRSVDPVSSWLIGKPNDGKVSIESTRLEGMSDHVVIPATHTFFPGNKTARLKTLAFLRQGRFDT